MKPNLIPAADADFAEVIYPFAMTYDGYAVWGDVESLARISTRDWDNQQAGRPLPSSLTRLRTALFAAGRAMRFTDFDEDVFGREGSEAAWKA